MTTNRAIFGDLAAESDGHKLHLRPAHKRALKEFVLDAAQARELMEFLRHCTEDEFNQRAAFRVQVYSNSGLEVALRVNGKPVLTIPRNISYTGVYVEAHPDNDPQLSKGGIVDVELIYDEKTLLQRGVIRRRSINGYGIFFPESIKHEDVNPHPQLKNIVQLIHQQRANRWKSSGL